MTLTERVDKFCEDMGMFVVFHKLNRDDPRPYEFFKDQVLSLLKSVAAEARDKALEEAENICDQHSNWRWLMKEYHPAIVGCPEAHGADLCSSAINILRKKITSF